MELKALHPMLYTKELKDSINFYAAVLGFTCVEYMEEWQWACMSKGNIEIMFAYPNEHTSFDKPHFTGTLYFIIDDVDSLWNTVKDRADVVYAPDNFDFGMREFAIRDNNGYVLQFGQELNR